MSQSRSWKLRKDRPVERCQSIIADLDQLDLRTPAARTVFEIIEFLNDSPTPEEIFRYHVSERAQEHLRYY